MKTFLNVLGLLSLLGAVAALFLPQNGPVLAVAAVAEAALFMALAKVIDLIETHLERTSTHRLMEREVWKNPATVIASSPVIIPPVPGTEKYYLAVNNEPAGPHTAETISELLSRGTIDREAWVLQEGGREWRRLREVFAEA